MQVIDTDLMVWLKALHLRAPACSVIIVGNKYSSMLGKVFPWAMLHAADVEKGVARALERWKDQRAAIPVQQPTDYRGINVLQGVSCVNCVGMFMGGRGLGELVDRIKKQVTISDRVPWAWNAAWTVLDAHKYGLDPELVVEKYFDQQEEPQLISTAEVTVHSRTLDSLKSAWNCVVSALQAQGKPVVNPDSALEGALWMR